jgi:hypothetical protein
LTHDEVLPDGEQRHQRRHEKDDEVIHCLQKRILYGPDGRQQTASMESMSLVELKQLAKGRRIKQYYIMRRAQLLQLLAMQELPKSFQ